MKTRQAATEVSRTKGQFHHTRARQAEQIQWGKPGLAKSPDHQTGPSSRQRIKSLVQGPDQPEHRHDCGIDRTRTKAKSLNLNTAPRWGGGIPRKAAQQSSDRFFPSHAPAPLLKLAPKPGQLSLQVEGVCSKPWHPSSAQMCQIRVIIQEHYTNLLWLGGTNRPVAERFKEWKEPLGPSIQMENFTVGV